MRPSKGRFGASNARSLMAAQAVDHGDPVSVSGCGWGFSCRPKGSRGGCLIQQPEFGHRCWKLWSVRLGEDVECRLELRVRDKVRGKNFPVRPTLPLRGFPALHFQDEEGMVLHPVLCGVVAFIAIGTNCRDELLPCREAERRNQFVESYATQLDRFVEIGIIFHCVADLWQGGKIGVTNKAALPGGKSREIAGNLQILRRRALGLEWEALRSGCVDRDCCGDNRCERQAECQHSLLHAAHRN